LLVKCGLEPGASTSARFLNTGSSSPRRRLERPHFPAIANTTTSALARSLSTSFSSSDLEYYSKKKQTAVSLKALMETGRGALLEQGQHHPSTKASEKILIQVACFLHRELPIRLAHRAIELEAGLFLKSENIKNVSSWYKMSFAQLRRCPAPINAGTRPMCILSS